MNTDHAAHVIALAVRIFGDRDKAMHWLARPSLQLGGRPPREFLATVDEARRVEELLTQIDDDDRMHPAPD